MKSQCFKREKLTLLFLSTLAVLSTLFVQCEREANFELPDYIPVVKAEYDSITPVRTDTVVMSVIDSITGAEKNQRFLCVTKKRSLSENPDEFACYDILSEILMPGLMVKGNTVFRGTPVVIPIEDYRKKIRVSLNVVSGGSGKYFREISPVYSEINNAMNVILNEYNASSPARYYFKSELLTSRTHLDAALRFGWSNPSNDLTAEVNFAYDENKTTLLVTLKQAFFTFSVDNLSEANAFIDGKAPIEIEPYLTVGSDGTPNPLAYISSVTYGRIYRLLYTTSDKGIDLKAAVDYAYNGAVNDLNTEAKVAYQNRMSKVSVTVYQLGGDAGAGLATAFIGDATNLSVIRDYIVEGAKFSKDNVGTPISYVVRTLKDNSVLAINNTLEFETKEHTLIKDPQVTDSTHVIDFDGNAYPIVKIGNQVWMKENLKTTRFNNGEKIPYFETPIAFDQHKTSPASCGHLATNHGLLYNWTTVGTGNLCPSGWHVPSYAEWAVLITNLGGSNVAGRKLKATGTDFWAVPNTGDNSSGFTALPGGRVQDGVEKFITTHAFWWTTAKDSDGKPYGTYVVNEYNGSFYNAYWNAWGLSVRCLKNE